MNKADVLQGFLRESAYGATSLRSAKENLASFIEVNHASLSVMELATLTKVGGLIAAMCSEAMWNC